MEDTTEATAKILVELVGETELTRTELVRTKLMAVYYWNSLKS